MLPGLGVVHSWYPFGDFLRQLLSSTDHSEFQEWQLGGSVSGHDIGLEHGRPVQSDWCLFDWSCKSQTTPQLQ